jgi:hypothetical protein
MDVNENTLDQGYKARKQNAPRGPQVGIAVPRQTGLVDGGTRGRNQCQKCARRERDRGGGAGARICRRDRPGLPAWR